MLTERLGFLVYRAKCAKYTLRGVNEVRCECYAVYTMRSVNTMA